jgi:RNA polymerase sigma factor (sigma-70 family)
MGCENKAKRWKKAVFGLVLRNMGFKDDTNSVNSPQIPSFQPEKQPPQLSIHIDDKEIRTEIGVFYREYYSLVYNRCLAILGNSEEAQDVAHDVFEKIQEQKAKGVLNIPYPKTYLSKAAANMGINKNKRARRELIEIYKMATDGSLRWFIDKGGEEGKEKWEAGIVDNGYDLVDAQIIVKAILNEQDETTRKIYICKYLNDMTLEEIGKAVGIRKSSVHERIKKLERQVRLQIGGADK